MKLKCDKIGACSGIVYGTRGQEVNVLDSSRALWLVEPVEGNKRQRFFVWPHDLTDEKEIKVVEEPKVVKPITFLSAGELKDSPSSLLFDVDPERKPIKKKTNRKK